MISPSEMVNALKEFALQHRGDEAAIYEKFKDLERSLDSNAAWGWDEAVYLLSSTAIKWDKKQLLLDELRPRLNALEKAYRSTIESPVENTSFFSYLFPILKPEPTFPPLLIAMPNPRLPTYSPNSMDDWQKTTKQWIAFMEKMAKTPDTRVQEAWGSTLPTKSLRKNSNSLKQG